MDMKLEAQTREVIEKLEQHLTNSLEIQGEDQRLTPREKMIIKFFVSRENEIMMNHKHPHKHGTGNE